VLWLGVDADVSNLAHHRVGRVEGDGLRHDPLRRCDPSDPDGDHEAALVDGASYWQRVDQR
jgi:hypothetical protein